uniref:hypothetical protein n=1 Tax=Prevotellamassilia timonensis TaxID=1852370 RepID=UPI003A9377E2
LAVLNGTSYVYFVQQLRHVLKLLPLQGATAPTRNTQGAASLALGYGLHWAFSPPLLNPKLKLGVFKCAFYKPHMISQLTCPIAFKFRRVYTHITIYNKYISTRRLY